eukprot:m.73814 g.73814  ORF g.73814 m.73814 type:complete len:567 (-) comp17058_c0_seq3:33-1733(-)
MRKARCFALLMSAWPSAPHPVQPFLLACDPIRHAFGRSGHTFATSPGAGEWTLSLCRSSFVRTATTALVPARSGIRALLRADCLPPREVETCAHRRVQLPTALLPVPQNLDRGQSRISFVTNLSTTLCRAHACKAGLAPIPHGLHAAGAVNSLNRVSTASSGRKAGCSQFNPTLTMLHVPLDSKPPPHSLQGVNGLAYFATECPDECYPEGLIADQANAALQWHADNADKGPFFLAVGFKRPHLSYKTPQRFVDMYPLDSISLPVHRTFPLDAGVPPIAYKHSCMMGQTDVTPYGFNMSCSSELCTEVITNDTTIRKLRQAYYASVSFTDYQLGKVLDKLEALQLHKNTVITFLGDHGYSLGQRNQWCKCNNFELTTRVPLFVVPPQGDPGYARNHTDTSLVESLDLYPTIAELAGVALPAHQNLGGESLVPLLKASRHIPAQLGSRTKNHALSQWARPLSCIHHHNCPDGGGDPSQADALMGYSLRVADYRYTAWFQFDYAKNEPVYTNISARELYTHVGDDGGELSGETFEMENLAEKEPTVVQQLHEQLVSVIKAALVPPVNN